ncbi:HAD family hydrolase [Gorillibacterium massiliense]|uniref:HAD family hydrolase n=1 Tax=Gorillibacterium massiliense TaxID=1280390 RepID=UPI0004B2D6D7|nr:HAD family hydrolase [Gorillibacterium massiliense]
MTLKAVLFDLDDTLLWDERSVQEAFAATCRTAAAKYPQLDADQLETEVRREARGIYEAFEAFPFTKMIGINPFEALWANFTEGEHESFRLLQSFAPGYRKEAWTRGLKALNVNDEELGAELAELFPKERRSRPLAYEETFEVLDTLRGKVKLLLLTNGAPDLQKEKIAGFPELTAYFDHIIISGEFGEGKPSKAIFNRAAELLDIEPAEGLMVGDKLTTDILGSGSIGMSNAWINAHNVNRTDEIIPTYEIKRLKDLLPIVDDLMK